MRRRGLKIKEQIAPNWLLIGDLNAGFDPISGNFANGPKSLVDNNNIPLAKQTTNKDSARSTGWDNSRGYVSLSNATFGTLTVGRQNSLSNDLAVAYNPFGGSYAFSALGNSSTFVAGTGDTELSQYNMSLKYNGKYDRFHVGALSQLGGYDQRNNAESAYQFDLGGDVNGLSVDAVYAYARDAVTLSNYTSGAPTPETLKGTLVNISAGVVAAKYNGRKLTVYGGYEYAVSAALDWRVLKRLDLYLGVMYSVVSGGLANGFIKGDNTAFTTGVSVAF